MPPNGPPYVTATIFLVLFYQLGENQWACIPRPSTGTQYSTVQYSTVQYSTVQYSIVCMVGELLSCHCLPDCRSQS